MAITGTMTWTQQNKHMVARTSNVKASTEGKIYDLVDSAVAVDNGMNVKAGAQVGSELQLRTAVTAGIGDELIFVSDVPLVYESFTSLSGAEFNFTNKAGKIFKGYQIVKEDTIGVSDYGFTTIINGTTGVQKGNFVVTDGARKWKELASTTATATLDTYGFLAQVIGFEKYQFDTIVLFRVIRNTTV